MTANLFYYYLFFSRNQGTQVPGIISESHRLHHQACIYKVSAGTELLARPTRVAKTLPNGALAFLDLRRQAFPLHIQARLVANLVLRGYLPRNWFLEVVFPPYSRFV